MCYKLQEEKIAAIQEKLELAEQKLTQYAKLPEMEEQLKQRMEALTQVRRPNQVRRGIISRHIANFFFLFLCTFTDVFSKVQSVSRELTSYVNMHLVTTKCSYYILVDFRYSKNNILLFHVLYCCMYDM